MSQTKERTLISKGDFIDVYHKIKQKGIGFLFSFLNLNSNKRVANKWNFHQSSSDFWIIPEITNKWNFKISGNEDVLYEDYVAQKHLKEKKNLRLLSIGCGDGNHERIFAKHDCFSEIIGVDLSEERIKRARVLADQNKLSITYFSEDFRKLNFEKESFDIIQFSSSLHHFENIVIFLKNEIKPLLKKEGLLVVFEYCGPNRLQWTKNQLVASNKLLQELPKKYKTLYDNKTLKKKVYRPGWFRMLLVDPSEAPDSANLVTAIHDNFKVIEETKLGWNILHLLLKGIAHNFLDNSQETKKWLNYLMENEEEFIEKNNVSDAVFGVYQKA